MRGTIVRGATYSRVNFCVHTPVAETILASSPLWSPLLFLQADAYEPYDPDAIVPEARNHLVLVEEDPELAIASASDARVKESAAKAEAILSCK